MQRNICVYSSSSDSISQKFFETSRELGAAIARNGYTLVYGGASVGPMGAIARSVHEHGGQVVGVMPEALHGAGITYQGCDELIITKDMRERKAIMEAKASAFVGFPGGFGTLEEIFEILTLKQLRYHEKPMVLLNAHHFYDPLVGLFEHIFKEKFAKESFRELYHISPDVDSIFRYLESYEPPQLQTKWT